MAIEGAELRPPDLVNLAGQTDEQVGRDHLSHSSIGTMLACLRRYGFAYDERLELISKPKPLGMGKAFHYAIETGDPMSGAQQLDRETQTQDEHDKLVVDKAIVFAAATAYLSRWPAVVPRNRGIVGMSDGGTLQPATPFPEPMIQREVEYRIRLRSPYTGRPSNTFDLLGYADGVIDHGGYLELIEDKFVGRVDSVSVKRVKLDRQVGLESYALWRITGKPVRIVRYRFTKKPSIKQKQNESLEEFVQRLNEDYMERRDDFYLHEEQTFRSDDDLLLLEAELWDWAEQLREAKRRGFFARNTASCGDYGGCQFLDICTGDPDARSLYRIKGDDEIKAEAAER